MKTDIEKLAIKFVEPALSSHLDTFGGYPGDYEIVGDNIFWISKGGDNGKYDNIEHMPLATAALCMRLIESWDEEGGANYRVLDLVLGTNQGDGEMWLMHHGLM